MVFKFSTCLLNEKTKYNFSTRFFVHLIILKIVPAFLFSQCFSPVYIYGRLLKQFQDLRRLSKQLLKSQATVGKPGTSFLKRLIGRISQLLSEVIEASRNLGLYIFFTKRQPNFLKTIQKYCFDFWTFKKSSATIFSRSPTFRGCFL